MTERILFLLAAWEWGVSADFAGPLQASFDDVLAALYEDPVWTPYVVPGADPALVVAPNPFNSRTTIRFDVTQVGRLSVDVFDLTGRLVRRLAAMDYSTGSHIVTWNGTSVTGHSVAPGMYFIRLEAGERSEVRPVVLLR